VAGDAVRLAQRINRVAGLVRDRLAHDLVAGAAIELHVAGEGERVGARLLQRLSHIYRFEPRQLLGPLEHFVPDAGEDAPALGGGQAPPLARRGASRRGDGGIDVVGPAPRDLGYRLAGRGILERQCSFRCGRDPLPADEAAGRIEPEIEVVLHAVAPASLSRSARSRLGVAAISSRV
jgi:hypothetical protein